MRLIDLFYKGGETIRGFNRGGFGPRDLLTGDALGGDTFWATTAEVRFPLPFVPDDLGMSGAVFADAGSLFGAGAGREERCNAQCGAGRRSHAYGVCLADSCAIRASAGVQHHLELAARAAAPRYRQGAHEGDLRQRAADPLRRVDRF